MRTVLAFLVVAVLSLLTYPGAGVVAAATRLRPPPAAGPAPAGAQPWLHVEHPVGQLAYIADPERRRVVLRGVVSGGLVDYWSGSDPADLAPPPAHPIDPAAYADGRCPANAPTVSQPPLCERDLAQMHALGFTVLRLALSWSLLEPSPGSYDSRYLDRIAQVVGWARAQGIYVILDMHENAYGRFVARPVPPPLAGGTPTALNRLSGAPAWAVRTLGLPSEVYLGQRELNPAVNGAFTSFWLDRAGLQEHYVGAVAALARRFAGDSTVLGYSPFNEPWPGLIPPPAFDDLFLWPFYRRVIDAITGAGDGLACPAGTPALAVCGFPDLGVHDRHHLFFLESDHLREQFDLPTHLPMPVSSYPNLVYSIHAYTHQFTIEAIAGQRPDQARFPPGGFEQSYASAEAEARSVGAALFVSEFGNPPELDDLLLTKQLQEQERHLVGATLWPWKENCTLGTTWGVYEGVFGAAPDQRCAVDRPPGSLDAAASWPQEGCLRAGRERLLARVAPRAIVGTDVRYHYDPATGAFRLTASAPPGAPTAEIAVPPQVTGAPSVGGGAALERVVEAADGSRLLVVRPQGGLFAVDVAAAPLRLGGCG
jgi:endoglycosylceramidase